MIGFLQDAVPPSYDWDDLDWRNVGEFSTRTGTYFLSHGYWQGQHVETEFWWKDDGPDDNDPKPIATNDNLRSMGTSCLMRR